MALSTPVRTHFYRVNLQSLAAGANLTTDINGDLMTIPQGFVIVGGHYGQNVRVQEGAASPATIDIGTPNNFQRWGVYDLVRVADPGDPTRGATFAVDAVFGDDNPDQAGRVLRIGNLAAYSLSGTGGSDLILNVYLRGYLRH